ncbi:hypothetical protein FZW96_07980 [Bacillus sp. BGMRC 2118]|nr:hypothetical protein FZW96_07980 [Bacillus sp. BGMRC 2118]
MSVLIIFRILALLVIIFGINVEEQVGVIVDTDTNQEEASPVFFEVQGVEITLLNGSSLTKKEQNRMEAALDLQIEEVVKKIGDSVPPKTSLDFIVTDDPNYVDISHIYFDSELPPEMLSFEYSIISQLYSSPHNDKGDLLVDPLVEYVLTPTDEIAYSHFFTIVNREDLPYSISELVTSNTLYDEIIYDPSTNEISAMKALLTYWQASSFTQYLIDTYGIDTYMQLFYRDIHSHKNIQEKYGKTLEELESEWLGFLQTIEPILDEEIEQAVLDHMDEAVYGSAE